MRPLDFAAHCFAERGEVWWLTSGPKRRPLLGVIVRVRPEIERAAELGDVLTHVVAEGPPFWLHPVVAALARHVGRDPPRVRGRHLSHACALELACSVGVDVGDGAADRIVVGRAELDAASSVGLLGDANRLRQATACVAHT